MSIRTTLKEVRLENAENAKALVRLSLIDNYYTVYLKAYDYHDTVRDCYEFDDLEDALQFLHNCVINMEENGYEIFAQVCY